MHQTAGLTTALNAFAASAAHPKLLLPPVRAMLTRAQKEIGFEYIKFHGILDDDLTVYMAGPGRKPELCFTYVDMVLDFLLELSLKPMIQFSFMPRLLAKHPDNQIFQKPVIISEPADEQEWCRLITAFTGHLLKRYGKDRVRTWIFTFWNETLNGLSFDFSHNDTALRLYRLTRRCVKDCDSALTFASTSYSALHFPETNYDIFLDYARKNHCLPDVFLFHFLSGGQRQQRLFPADTAVEGR